MKKKLSLLISLSLVAMLILTGCGSGKSEKNENVFRVGMEAGYPPFNWTQMDDSNGAVKIEGSSEYAGGYDVEIAKKIAEGLGKELVIVKTEWDGLVPALTSGKIDAIIAGMSPTAERRETIDFSNNYYQSQLVLVVKNGGQYENAKTLADFNGAKVTAQLNTFHYSVIDQIKGVKKQEAMDNFPAMRVALESGVIDAYVSEKPEAVSAQSANRNFKMIELQDGFVTNPEDTQTAVGIKKNSDLTQKVNEILSGISEEEQVNIMGDAVKNQPAAQ
ncbi:transporter substrate-binding domain-containing protein [Clostridium sp. DSM 100503]|uniref:transporter substrate-binding domain-containing protein n=1 Tax=Clostridium sp. DSM 100503 TaxID=2963282 RepID=UPI002149A8F7|nr:transporter substrate-binding domain-containing protein [Clostridium sp. DSM 100503]MCR1953116.1 transporter substrate-binding domain-containing protein [Clostridium sp. DSM 100503]